jgi:predicted dehydrogenase
MIRLAVIGYGYWGPNLVRNFYNTPDCKITLVVDSREERLQLVKKAFPAINISTQINDALTDKDIDAVVIATPVFTHFGLAKTALQNGKHVLIEKPMTRTVKEAEELIELAQKHNKLLMIDHTFLYTGAVQYIRKLIESGDIGKTNYFDSTRINLGLFQPDINVLWDLAPHDISVLKYIHNEKPFSVNATGVSHTNNKIENIAYMTINYQSGFMAHFSCSWSSPVKIRSVLIGGDKKMILYNDIEPTEKIKIYDTGYSVKSNEDKQKILVDYRTGDVFIPKLDTREALAHMANDFIQSIIKSTSPVSNYELGIDIVKILEAADNSLKENGKEIKL